MGIILTFLKNKKVKIKTVGKTSNLIVLLVAISKFLSEKIAQEKNLELEQAESIVIDFIKDGMKTLSQK
ncbi:MAG: hypothetical protein HFG68_08095 [Hungatella sp.]|nr:hypothetical protein [Hungatella sp.]